jgi:hypothetical protein
MSENVADEFMAKCGSSFRLLLARRERMYSEEKIYFSRVLDNIFITIHA